MIESKEDIMGNTQASTLSKCEGKAMRLGGKRGEWKLGEQTRMREKDLGRGRQIWGLKYQRDQQRGKEEGEQALGMDEGDRCQEEECQRGKK